MPVCTSPHGAGYRHVCCHAFSSKSSLAVRVLKREHRCTPNPHVHAHSSVPEQCHVHAAPDAAIPSAWIWVPSYMCRVTCGYIYSYSIPCKVLDHFPSLLFFPIGPSPSNSLLLASFLSLPSVYVHMYLHRQGTLYCTTLLLYGLCFLF